MKICVYGAGAIGGHLAARLARGGADVSLVARGAHLAAIQANGLRVLAPDGPIHATVAATDDPATLGAQDAVLVTVKAPALPSVAAAIAPLLRAETPVVFVMNGIPWWYFHAHGGALDGRRLDKIDPGGALWNAVGPERAVGGVVYSACTVTAPGIIAVEGATSRLVLGRPDGTIPPALAAVAAAVRAGGFTVVETDRIRDWVWSKLLMNLSTGPMSVLCHAAPGSFLHDPVLLATLRAVLAEGQAVVAALGCTPQTDIASVVERSQSMTHEPSILQDLKLGRPMEIEGILGATLDLARLSGTPTPTLDLLVALTRARGRTAGLYAPTMA